MKRFEDVVEFHGHSCPGLALGYRVSMFALKELGVEYLVSTAAVGSLKKELEPCDFVIADQLIDRSFKRSTTFFEEGIVAHVGFADPLCTTLSDLAFEVARRQGVITDMIIIYPHCFINKIFIKCFDILTGYGISKK